MTVPTLHDILRVLATLAVGALGAGLFLAIGFPVAPLTGAAVAVSVAGIAGLAVHIPNWLRNVTFATLGINIGSSVTPELAAGVATWPGSLLILALTLVAALYATREMLERLFGFDRTTATLSSTPGHLGYVLGLAAEGGRDIVTISIVQSTRVLCLTVLVPPLIAFVFGATGASFLPETLLSLPHAVLLYLGSAAMALVLWRARVPAAWLIAAMGVSAAGHLTELAPGRLPSEITALALVVMGALIGTRFQKTPLARLRAAMLAGLAVTAMMGFFALVGSALVAVLMGFPLRLMLVAFAPGGVEAMAAIALQLGLDPPFVAAHHVFRLVLLTFLVPLLMRGQR